MEVFFFDTLILPHPEEFITSIFLSPARKNHLILEFCKRLFEQEYVSKTWFDYQKDKKIQKLMDRTVENILTALIEVCGTVLTQQEVAVENYAQALERCAGSLGFSETEQKDLAKLAMQRNRLAQRYLNFRWQAVFMFTKLKPLVSRLLARILEMQ